MAPGRQLSVSGGTGGTLELQTLVVDEGDVDYIFATATGTVPATHKEGARLGSAVLDTGPGVSVTDAVYLGTFTYQPTAGATGVFMFTVEGDGRSYLLDSNATELATETSSTTVVGYGIDCFNDGHCDDSNDCTADSCVDYACQYTNVSSGTACDDGLYCTATDTCDGAGTCKGSRATPCPSGWTCDEVNDYCLPN